MSEVITERIADNAGRTFLRMRTTVGGWECEERTRSRPM